MSGRNKDIWFSYEEGGRFTSYDQIQNHTHTGINYSQNTLPGDYWYEDWNGDGIVNDADRHPVASFNLPVFNYGITMGADWKGIDFSMNWQGAAGVYNKYDEVFAEVGPFDGSAALEMYKDRWHTVNVMMIHGTLIRSGLTVIIQLLGILSIWVLQVLKIHHTFV